MAYAAIWRERQRGGHYLHRCGKTWRSNHGGSLCASHDTLSGLPEGKGAKQAESVKSRERSWAHPGAVLDMLELDAVAIGTGQRVRRANAGARKTPLQRTKNGGRQRCAAFGTGVSCRRRFLRGMAADDHSFLSASHSCGTLYPGRFVDLATCRLWRGWRARYRSLSEKSAFLCVAGIFLIL